MNCPHCDVHIDEHEATRCLDAWVAEKVFEYEMEEFHEGGLKSYSTHISAAWTLIEKLADDNWIVSVAWGNGADGRKYASIQLSVDLFLKADLMNRPWTQMDAKALSVPLAICRASIKANHNAR